MRYDVIVVGASFAGLAAAQALAGYRVLVVDQRCPGEHQTSACATPLSTVRAVGAQESILEVHPALVLHASGQEIRFELADPYVTFDYRIFCQAMLARTDAEVLIARATGYGDGSVASDHGTLRGRFVVDATGWAAALSGGRQAGRAARALGYGLETELPVRLELSPGLHFYCLDNEPGGDGQGRWGYAWAFPCGQTVRLGVGYFGDWRGLPPRPSLDRGELLPLRGTHAVRGAPRRRVFRYGDRPAGLRAELERFVSGFGLRVGPLHGGVLSFGYREPVAGDLFVVGDAAGHCLPLTGEGIRTAIYHGLHCGRAIRGALAGEFSPQEARSLYRELVLSRRHTHHYLSAIQRVVAVLPAWWLAALARAVDHLELDGRLMNRYLRDSGWFVGHSWSPMPARVEAASRAPC